MTTIRCTLMLALFTAVIAAPGRAQTPSESPFSIYGFVTQGLGVTASLPIMGLPTTGTADYRAVALQARFRVDDKSSVVTQVSHRRLGESALAALEPPLELDWAFYRRSIGPVSVSVGRVPIPRGLYNEIRDVGTLLPFYRAPAFLYADGTEAVDGVTATTRMDFGRWAVEANVYAGGMEWKAVAADTVVTAFAVRSERNAGTQLWLYTPITGVRAGVSYLNFEDDISDSGRSTMWIGSLELDRDRWMVRSEVTDVTLAGLDIVSGYVHGRFKITPEVHVMGQYEQADIDMTVPVALGWTEMKDGALGVAYAPSSQLVFKLEGHRAEGYMFDVPMNRFAPPSRTNYAILSMSVSF